MHCRKVCALLYQQNNHVLTNLCNKVIGAK